MMVTVAVTTYNSAEFILETLESIFNQTYSKIELIISDDESKDQTVTIVKHWLAQKRVQERFEKLQLITVPNNTGVSANCNRCIAAASSDWIKFLAGDDILFPTCIEENMAFAAKNIDARIIFSQVKLYQDYFTEENFIRLIPENFPNNLMHPKFKAKDQYQLLLLSDRITFTPSFFCKKEALVEVGNFDEQNRLLEDYPLWLKLTKAGIRLYFMEKVTVAYRQHAGALNNMINYGLFKPQYLNLEKIKKLYVYPNLPWDLVGQMKFKYFINKLFDKIGFNKNTNFHRKLYHLFTVYFNPFQYIISFKKHFLSLGKTNIFYAN